MLIEASSIVKFTSNLKHCHELLFGNSESLIVATVHNKYDGVGVGVIASPVWPYRCLTSKIPNLLVEQSSGSHLKAIF